MYTKRNTIREYGGKVIGFIDEDDDGNQEARSFGGKVLGRYDKATNMTRDFGGKVLSIGNTLAALLYQNK